MVFYTATLSQRISSWSTDEAKLIDFGLASEVQAEPFTHFRGEINNEKEYF